MVDLGTAGDDLEKMNEEAIQFEETLNSIAEKLGKTAKSSDDLKNLIRAAASNSKSLASSAKTLSKISQSDLKDQKKANKIERDRAKVLQESTRQKAFIAELEKRSLSAGPEEVKLLNEALEKLYDQKEVTEQIEGRFDSLVDVNQKLAKETKWTDKMAKSLKTIPGLGPLIADPLKNASKAYREARVGDKKLGIKSSGRLKSMAKSAGVIADAFGPAALLGFFFTADKKTTALANSLQISKSEAQGLKLAMNQIAIDSGKAYLNNKNQIQALMELSSGFGVTKGISSDLIENQVRLTKQFGLSADEAFKLNKYSEFTGKSSKTTNKEIANQVASLQKETGIALDLRDVFREVTKANAGLQAAYGFNNKLIAEQVVLTKKIGLNLDQAGKMASQLLDFESSISKELEAELLTGKNLNLEKARLLALQGKNTEAAAEMAKQVGGTAELSRMNVLQQEALAEAVGLSRNELIESVQQREILEKIGDRNLQQLYDEYGTREAIAAITGEELLKSMEQESSAAKFESAVIKLQEAFANIVEGPLGSVIDMLANAANSAGVLKTILVGIMAISIGKLILSIASMAASLAASATGAMATMSALTLGIGAVAIIGGIVAMVAALNSAMGKAESQTTISTRNVNDGQVIGNVIKPLQKGTIEAGGVGVQGASDDTLTLSARTPGGGNTTSSNLEEKFNKMIELLTKGNENTAKTAAKDFNLTVKGVPNVNYFQEQANGQETGTTSLS